MGTLHTTTQWAILICIVTLKTQARQAISSGPHHFTGRDVIISNWIGLANVIKKHPSIFRNSAPCHTRQLCTRGHHLIDRLWQDMAIPSEAWMSFCYALKPFGIAYLARFS